MARQRIRPTDAELEILTVLWEQGRSTAREIYEALIERGHRPVGATTILKLIQIMVGKGSVTRDDSRRPQVYIAAQTEDETQRLLANDLVARAFGGSAHKLVMQALAGRKASKEELQAIRKLLDEHVGDES